MMTYKKVSLKMYPEKIAPMPRNTSGINITKGDSWVSVIKSFLLL